MELYIDNIFVKDSTMDVAKNEDGTFNITLRQAPELKINKDAGWKSKNRVKPKEGANYIIPIHNWWSGKLEFHVAKYERRRYRDVHYGGVVDKKSFDWIYELPSLTIE